MGKNQDNIAHAEDKWANALNSNECGIAADGSEEEACYIEESYDMKCDYHVEAWALNRTIMKEGTDQVLKWPESNVKPCVTVEIGCERERQQLEEFEAQVTVTDGKEHVDLSCDHGHLSLALWQQLQEGYSYYGKRYVLGGLDCDSIEVKEYVDISAKFAGAEKATTSDGLEVKCCCLDGKSMNVCLLAQIDPNAEGGFFDKLGMTDPHGCGNLVAKMKGGDLHTFQWHSYKKTALGTCSVLEEDANKLTLKPQEL